MSFLVAHKSPKIFVVLIVIFFIALSLRLVSYNYDYLLFSDSYYHYRMAKEITVNGERPELDLLRLSPIGMKTTYEPFLHYFLAYTYLFVASLGVDVTLLDISKFYPAFFGAVSLLPIYLFVARLFNRRLSFYTVLILGVMPGFLERTMAGFTRLEPLVIFFMFTCFFLFLRRDNKSIFFSGLFIGLIGLSWDGIGFPLFLLFFLTILRPSYRKKFIAVLSIGFILSSGYAQWDLGFNNLFNLNKGGGDIGDISQKVTVRELESISLQKALSLGSVLWFFLPVGFYRLAKKKTWSGVFLFAWLFFSLILTFNAVRFFVFFSMPLAVIAAFSLIPVKSKFSHVLLLSMVLITTFAGLNLAFKTKPMVDDELFDALAWIKDNTPEDATIAAWWDYGYVIQASAERRTINDGGSQQTVRTIDVSRALSTSDENESIRILSNYNADYLLIDDRTIGLKGEIMRLGNNSWLGSVLERLWKEEELKGFKLKYQNQEVKIYLLRF